MGEGGKKLGLALFGSLFYSSSHDHYYYTLPFYFLTARGKKERVLGWVVLFGSTLGGEW